MRQLYLLLSPRFLSFRNTLRDSGRGSRKKTYIMALVGFLFWGILFALSARVLLYFRAEEVIGDILAHHLLSMVFLTLFSLLIFSHVVTALSNLYLSRDLELGHSSPATLEEIFLSRWVLTLIDSSWMVIIFGMPILMAYGYVYRPDYVYYLNLIHLGLSLTLIAAGIGILFTMIMVSVFPAQRTRDVVMLLALIMIVALYFLFRFLKPERLVDPDAFFTVMQYVSALKTPDSPYLPTHWVTEILWVHLDRSEVSHLFEMLLTWSTAAALLVINIWVARAVYFTGFSKSQEAKRRRGTKKILDALVRLGRFPLGEDLASVLEKDVRTFFRDNTQWSQLLLLGALVLVYLYNFSVLPLERSPIRLEFLQNEIAFLAMGLAGFVLSAVSVRFVFPAVSSEGEAFWILRSSPMNYRRFLWGKFGFYLLPMLVLGEILTIFTNVILHVTPLMMSLCSVTMALAVFGIVALAVGLGALYPNFKHENIAQVATGFGGLLYMMISAVFLALIIVLEAGPVYMIFMADVRHAPLTVLQWFLIISSFLAVLVIIGLAVRLPMKMGIEALERFE